MTGHYVALEGVEGAGKSTVAAQLAALLARKGIYTITVREPGGTSLGEGIRRLLLDGDEMEPWTEALLFAAQRAQLAAEVVGPALQQGSWVISDRSVYSSLAYQGGARRLGIDKVRMVNEAGLQGVWPELVVLLRVPAEEGLARQEIPDRIGGQGTSFQRAVADAYERLAETEPDRFWVVDAGRPLGDVVEAVFEEVCRRWPC